MPSLTSYLRAVARELCSIHSFSTTTGVGTTSTVVCTEFAEAASNAILGADTFNGCWIFLESGAAAEQVRRVTSFAETTGTFTISSNRPFSAASGNGTAFSIYNTMPPVAQAGIQGIREAINEALRNMWIIDRLVFTGVDNQLVYSLASDYSWLINQRQIIALYDPLTPAVPKPSSNRPFLRYDGQLPQLELDRAYNTGDTFFLDVYRPANTWIATASTWAAAGGLVNLSDEAVPPITAVKNHALYYCYVWLANQTPDGDGASKYWQSRADRMARRVAWDKFLAAPYSEYHQPQRKGGGGYTGYPMSGWP